MLAGKADIVLVREEEVLVPGGCNSRHVAIRSQKLGSGSLKGAGVKGSRFQRFETRLLFTGGEEGHHAGSDEQGQ